MTINVDLFKALNIAKFILPLPADRFVLLDTVEKSWGRSHSLSEALSTVFWVSGGQEAGEGQEVCWEVSALC